MRHLGAAVIGLAAVLGGLASPVLNTDVLVWSDLGIVLMMVGFYAGVPLAVLAPIGYAFRVLGTRSMALEWRARVTLGEPLSTLVRGEARRGAVAGAWASGAGVAVGVLLQTVTAPVQPGTTLSVSVLGLVGLAAVMALTVGVTSAVYALAAGRGATVSARASAAGAHEAPLPPRERRLRRWAWAVLAVLVGLAGLVALWDRIWFIRDGLEGSALVYVSNLVGFSRGFALLGGLVLLARLVARGAVGLSAAAAGPLGRSSQAAGAMVAADGLRRRSRTRVLAAGTIGTVLMLAAWLASASGIDSARSAVASDLSPLLAVATSESWDGRLHPAGFESEALPAEAVNAVLVDPRIVAVPFALLRGQGNEYLQDYHGVVSTEVEQFQALVVDPADLARVSPDGLRPLGLQDGTVTRGFGGIASGDSGEGNVVRTITLPASELEAFVVNRYAFDTFATRAWAEADLGAAPVTGLLLWPADGDDVDALRAAAQEHLSTDLLWWDLAAPGPAVFISLGVDLPIVILGIALLIGVALTTALAVTTARDRRGELATLDALGASRRGLRAAPMIEVAVTVVAAALVAVPVGTALGILGSHPTLLYPGAPLDPGETWWGLGWEVLHTDWRTPLILVSATLACAIVAAAIAGVRMVRSTPAEQLREAQKEGVL